MINYSDCHVNMIKFMIKVNINQIMFSDFKCDNFLFFFFFFTYWNSYNNIKLHNPNLAIKVSEQQPIKGFLNLNHS